MHVLCKHSTSGALMNILVGSTDVYNLISSNGSRFVTNGM